MKLFKLFHKHIYNILSLLNVSLGFLFIIILGRKYGAGDETDIFFLSIMYITYLSILVSTSWSSIRQYYLDTKFKSKVQADCIYNILLFTIILLFILISLLYFFISSHFNLFSFEQKEFFDIIIFYLLFRNLIDYNKVILNLEKSYSQGYIVEILINVFNVIAISIFSKNINYIAYSMIISSFIALSYQWYIVYFKIKINFSIKKLNFIILQNIYINSLKYNSGGLLHKAKELLIASVLTEIGSGIYSLYSYANKFVGVIIQVVNAPIYNIFVTNITETFAKKEILNIRKKVKNIQIKLFILYSCSSVITYFLISIILELIFTDKFSDIQISQIKDIFVILAIYFLIITFEGPILTVVNLCKNFNYVLMVNFIFFSLICIGYVIFTNYSLTYNYLFLFLIVVQLSNILMFYNKYNKLILKDRNDN